MSDLPTLYRLADGTQAAPGDCSPNDKGVLTHKSGMPVVMDSDGKPVEIAREAVVNKTAQAANAGKDADAGMKPVEPAVVGKVPDPKPAVEPKPVEPPKV